MFPMVYVNQFLFDRAVVYLGHNLKAVFNHARIRGSVLLSRSINQYVMGIRVQMIRGPIT